VTIKSNTPAHDKDCWQTPLWLFDALDIEFGFWLDSAASDKNAPESRKSAFVGRLFGRFSTSRES
jgi:phage N-6-adenine-methyltransferase